MSFKPYVFKNWKEICEEKDAEIARLNKAIENSIERLEELELLSDSYEATHAYNNSIFIIKDEVADATSK